VEVVWSGRRGYGSVRGPRSGCGLPQRRP
jgi:hypothetical protein